MRPTCTSAALPETYIASSRCMRSRVEPEAVSYDLTTATHNRRHVLSLIPLLGLATSGYWKCRRLVPRPGNEATPTLANSLLRTLSLRGDGLARIR